ncbi:hypothetical protein [Paenibacillus sp. Marseille-Q7038]
MNHMKKWISGLMSLIFVLSAVVFIHPSEAKAIGMSRLFQDPSDKNVYYFVGMVYFEVWKKADGSWTNEKNQILGQK